MLSGPGTTSFDEVFSPGDQIGIGAGLNASADAAAGCLSTDCSDYVGTATAAANGADTGRFFIDVLSAGGGYVSASGTIYPVGPTNVVPEPTSLTLLGSGLLAIVANKRRRRA